MAVVIQMLNPLLERRLDLCRRIRKARVSPPLFFAFAIEAELVRFGAFLQLREGLELLGSALLLLTIVFRSAADICG